MVCRDVPLAPSEPGLASDGAAAGTVAEAVVGSFVEGGLTYAVVDEGKASLMAVDPAGSVVKPDEGAEGQLSSASDATVFEQMVDPDGDGVSMFASDGCDVSAILALPAAVEHGDVAYELSSLGPRALAGCAAEAVVIPATVSSIDETALLDAAVQRVEVDSANPAYASFDGVLYSADLVRLLSIPGGRKGAVRIPDNTEAIEPSALSHMAGVTSVSVDAGSATFSSRNGCLYDATGDTLLWEPPTCEGEGVAEGAASSDVCSAPLLDDEGFTEFQALGAAGEKTVIRSDIKELYVWVQPKTRGNGFVFPNGVDGRDHRRLWVKNYVEWELPSGSMYMACDGRFSYDLVGERAYQVWGNLYGQLEQDTGKLAPSVLWGLEHQGEARLSVSVYPYKRFNEDGTLGLDPKDSKFKGWDMNDDGEGRLEIYTDVPAGPEHDERLHIPAPMGVKLYARNSHVSNLYMNLTGGTLPDGAKPPTSYDGADKKSTLPEPTRKDAVFAGWRLSDKTNPSEGLVKIEGETVMQGSVTVYKSLSIMPGSVGYIGVSAVWISTLYCNLDGGEYEKGKENLTSYASCWGDYVLSSPSWPVAADEVTFLGWQIAEKDDDVNIRGEKLEHHKEVYKDLTICGGSIGTVKLRAVWQSPIRINYNGGVIPEGVVEYSTFCSDWGDTMLWNLDIDPSLNAGYVVFGGWKFIGTPPDTLKLSGLDYRTGLYPSLTIQSGSKGLLYLRAEWISTLYINYDDGELDEGKVNPSSYSSTSLTFTLAEPKRQGAKFGGWLVTRAPVSDKKLVGALVDTVEFVGADGELVTQNVLGSATFEQGTYGDVRLKAVWRVAVDFELSQQPVDGSAAASWSDGFDPPSSIRTIDGDVKLPSPVREGYRFLGWAIRSEDGTEAVSQDAVTKGLDGIWGIHPSKLPDYAKPLQPTGGQDPAVTFVARWSSAISVDAPLKATFLYDEASAAQSRTAYAEGGATFRNQSPTPMRVVGLESEATDSTAALIRLGAGGSGGAKVLSMRPADEEASSEGAASMGAVAWGDAERIDFALDDLLLEAAFAGKGFDIPGATATDEPGLLYVAYRLNLEETGSSIDYDALAARSPFGGDGATVTDRGATIGRPVPIAKVSYAFAPVSA